MTTTPKAQQQYIPGVCNIGPAERKMRRMSGVASSVVTGLILIVLIVTDAPLWWRLILIIPAAGAAIGFLQDALHFCAGFGMKGIFNVMNNVGITDNVDREDYRLKDKRKAQMIVVWSGLSGLIVAGLSLLL